MLLVATSAAGCAHTVGEMSKVAAGEATPVVIREGLEALDSAETRRQLASLLSSPEVRDATRHMVAALTDGTLDALMAPERAERIGLIVNQFISQITSAVGRGMRTSIGPEVVRMVGQTIDASLQRALSSENQVRFAIAIGTVVDGTVSAMAESYTRELRPAVRATLREDIGPALRDGLQDPLTHAALGLAVRTLTKEAVLGMQEAFLVIDKREQRGQTLTLLSGLQRMTVEGSNLFRSIAIGLGIAVVLLAFWLVRTRSRMSLAAKEGERRESALLALATALKSVDSKPWSQELHTALAEALRDDDKAEYLDEFWRKNKGARLRARASAAAEPDAATPST